MKANIVRLQSTLSFSLVLLGVYVMLGWTLVNGVMVRVIPGSVAMGMNAAGLFIATGLCLWSATGSGMFSIKLRNILPWLLVILPSLILVEHTFDVSLGIDWPSLHALVKDGNSRPGRVAPNTCLAFVFTGIALILFPRASTSKVFRVVLTALTGATLFIGLTALLGYALNLEGMYRLAKYNRMAAATAASSSCCGK